MKQKTKKASILAFTLVMMGILLAAGLSLMGATIVDQKVALESGDSVQALQNAESGTEVAVSVLSGNFVSNDPTLDDAFDVTNTSFQCTNGVVTNTNDASYKLTFYEEDASGNEVEVTDCNSTLIYDMVSVKSVGTNQNTTRAVQVALAAGCECGQLCFILNSLNNSLDNPERDDILYAIENDEIFPDKLICKTSSNFRRVYSGINFFGDLNTITDASTTALNLSICSGGFDVYGIKACSP
jgi:hypothetical protein